MLPYGIIIGGGGASRFGGVEKLLLHLDGDTMLSRLLSRVVPQTAALALNIRQSARSLYDKQVAQDISLLDDAFAGEAGPLGGVMAGLDWTFETGAADWLATFPADTPFLPMDLVSRLMAKAETGRPVVARSGRRLQPLCALWPLSCREALRTGIEKGDYRGVGWTLDAFGAIKCDFSDERVFFNVNTPDDLVTARQLAISMDVTE